MLAVAVLFSVFSFSLGNAFYEKPEYNDFCKNRPYPQFNEEKRTSLNCSFVQSTIEEQELCNNQDGNLEQVYGDDGCVSSYECNTCEAAYDTAREGFSLIIFIFMSIIGIISIIVALVTTFKNEVIEWIANGFLLGGLISLFIGTVVYFDYAPRFVRPIIMLIELVIIIVVAVKKLPNEKLRKKK